MQIVFRTDASIQIGTGHVMRCLTLADALAQLGYHCEFICRAHFWHLGELIQSKGYTLHLLSLTDLSATAVQELNWNAHAPWLGTTWQQDADLTLALLKQQKVDWLVVDHYALDQHWERRIYSGFDRLMVIDDLADRPHACDLLLDQTFGRNEADYRPLVPAHCQLLCGSQYALLRPEFAALRPYSLQRRAQPVLRELLITMGGVDKDNATGQVLQALRTCALSPDCRITVVLGATAPWLDEVRKQAQDMPWSTRVLVGVSDMAQLMADSDLAIGAAGATSWERCCLGLPTIMLVLAENQRKIAQELQQAGAAALVTSVPNVVYQLAEMLGGLASSPQKLHDMSKSSAGIVDGTGTHSVTALLEAIR
ncbi:UDP-2,4-diacetamido-2,4,6-trideoxy-beta-L-altropyranose hydrolase [Ectothiorhodospira shaposhnikovii]|uniref:UDP-2,4-diacetamido-2,4, 6-trideoxy-beta-L-altropyranose hydrolase n=1 Tax=Ectothiorhodospira shaposhnikovii TaxID=1054 RepID=UPI0039A3EAB6